MPIITPLGLTCHSFQPLKYPDIQYGILKLPFHRRLQKEMQSNLFKRVKLDIKQTNKQKCYVVQSV